MNTKFPNLNKFNFSLNDFIYSIEFFESIVAFKVDRKLCLENFLVENKGFKSDIEDKTIDENFTNFRSKFDFLYKFKIVKKIERFLMKNSYKKKSKALKRYFK